MTSSADELFEKYKTHPFGKGILSFTSAIKSLDSPVPAIFAQQDGKQRWVICEKGSGRPALFSYVAVVAQCDSEETGNYVPAGKDLPAGVEPKVIQIRPNMKCFYTYVFDTYSDWTLYEGQWALDAYVSKIPDFNPRNLPRRAYLSGQEEKFRSRFYMQTPMFLRRGPREVVEPAPAFLHEWVVKGDKDSTPFKANPDRPRVWMKLGDDIVPISARDPSRLQRGDSVVVSFTVTYHMTSVNWFAQFHPADIVVLKPWDGDATDYSAPALGLHGRPPPSFNTEVNNGTDIEDIETGGVATHAIEGLTVGRMEGVEGGTAVALGTSLEAVEVTESMEIDDSVRAGGSGGGSDGVTVETELIRDFDVINRDDQEDGHFADGFIDVAAEVDDKRVSKSIGAKSGRSSRKNRS